MCIRRNIENCYSSIVKVLCCSKSGQTEAILIRVDNFSSFVFQAELFLFLFFLSPSPPAAAKDCQSPRICMHYYRYIHHVMVYFTISFFPTFSLTFTPIGFTKQQLQRVSSLFFLAIKCQPACKLLPFCHCVYE